MAKLVLPVSKRLVLALGGLLLVGQAAPSAAEGQKLQIAMHDGFTGQTVTIKVNGREVYRRADVKTDLRISRADAVETDAAGPTATVEGSVEPGGQHATTTIDPAATPYLGVDVTQGAIHFTPSREMFRYM